MQTFWLTIAGILFGCLGQAQSNISVDTSFTFYSAFTKESKQYPFITIANATLKNDVTARRNLVYTSVGKRALHADVFYPSKKIKRPGIILLHGGGWRSGNKLMAVPMAIELANRGYVTVAIEYRLSPEAKYPAGVIDVRAAIGWLRNHATEFHLDKNKMAVLGTSSGGQMAALLATTNRYDPLNAVHKSKGFTAIQAAIDIDGILAFKHPESAEGAAAAAWLGGTYEEKPKVWDEASALSHVDKNSTPILFINSSLPRFHAGRDDMIRKLDSLHIYHEVHTLPDTPHPFWLFHPWFNTTVDLVVEFLKKVF